MSEENLKIMARNLSNTYIVYIHEFGFWTERFTRYRGEVSMKNVKE
jgi:hypothetical protein